MLSALWNHCLLQHVVTDLTPCSSVAPTWTQTPQATVAKDTRQNHGISVLGNSQSAPL